MMFPVILRFFSFGDAISRYTCASVSKPLIDSTAWPNAIMITTKGMFSQRVPFHQPKASLEKCRCAGVGAGGR